MSDWGWVAFAYGVVYVTLGSYLWSIVGRVRRAQRALGGR
jgi:hypothetical protein